MQMLLNSFKNIATVPDTYTYTSPIKQARYLWTLLFGFLTGDLNSIHVNPLTASEYKSKLGGLARHGVSTLAQAESFIFKIFKFTEPTEIIAKGYDNIRYLCPVNIGDKITYTYILISKKISEEKKFAECSWEMSATNQNGKKVFTAVWVIIYCAVEKKVQRVTMVPVPLGGGVIDCEMTDKEFYVMSAYKLAFFAVIGMFMYFVFR